MKPPPLAVWIVAASLHPVERDQVFGDLEEEFRSMAASSGSAAARRWYWRQTMASVAHNLRRRLTRRTVTHIQQEKAGAMDSTLQDLRFGWRMMRRRPIVTSVALASLVLGIATATVVFSLLDAVLLRPLPVADPDRLAVMLEVRPDGINHNFSYPDFADYRAAQRSLTGMAAYSRTTLAVGQQSGSQVMAAELVSGSYFGLLGPRMRFGRALSEDDDRPGAAPVAVVSGALWDEMAGPDSAFAPRSITLNALAVAIVGVVDAPFRGMEVGRDARVWLPLHMQPALEVGSANYISRRTTSWLTVIGRLAPDAERATAAQDLMAVEASLAGTVGRKPRTLTLAAGRLGDSSLPVTMASPLTLLLGAALLVFLIACANVANLLVARSTERARELAVRAALGAGRARLARLVLIETLVLAAAGTAMAVIVAQWMALAAVPLITRYGEPVTLDLSLNLRIVAFVSVMGLVATLTSGLAPLAGTLRASLPVNLADGGRAASSGPSGQRLRHTLNVVQFALSLALVVSAALLARTVYNLRTLSPGFDIEHVALVEIDPEQAQYDTLRTRAYLDRAIERLASLPGVKAAGFGRVIPLGFGGSRMTIIVAGYQPAQGEDMEINFNVVSSSYFEAMGIPLTDGRVFDTRDVTGRPQVAIVNQTMATRYWPGQPAVGRRLTFDEKEPDVEVIGIVADVKYRMLREESGPSFYLPVAQFRAGAGVLHVRTDGDPSAVLGTVRRSLAEVDPAVPIAGLRTLHDQARLNLTDERLAMTIGVTLGGAALLRAAVGLYGSMAFAVGRRTRELGVRAALGATAGDLRRLVLAEAVRLSIVGAAAGLVLAVPLARTIESRLFGVRAADVPTLVAAILILGAVAIAASWSPARRAARVDPAEVLRAD